MKCVCSKKLKDGSTVLVYEKGITSATEGGGNYRIEIQPPKSISATEN